MNNGTERQQRDIMNYNSENNAIVGTMRLSSLLVKNDKNRMIFAVVGVVHQQAPPAELWSVYSQTEE